MITNIEDLKNVKVGDVVDISLSLKKIDGQNIKLDAQIECCDVITCIRRKDICRECAFVEIPDCYDRYICHWRHRPDENEVYFKLLKSK